MRDPRRIGRVLFELFEIWDRNPDIRLGQLLLNSYDEMRLYNVEDDELMARLRELYLPAERKGK